MLSSSALTLELVHEALVHGGFWPLAAGCVGGGVAFELLNSILNSKGGFLRKTATLIRHVRELKKKRVGTILEHLSRVPVLRALPPEEIQALVPHVEDRAFDAGTKIVAEGEPGFELYIVEEGELEVTQNGNKISLLKANDIFGEIALLTNEARTATVTTKTKVKLLEIHKQDFDHLLVASPELADEVKKLSEMRKHELETLTNTQNAKDWAQDALENVDESVLNPTSTELRQVVEEHKKQGGAPLAIWLGIFIDGIPESAVIGASMIGEAKVSLALIVGLFLANLPESLSSAVGMKKMGMSTFKINVLWWSLAIMTGVGAYIGNITFQNASPQMVGLFEGLAAGAMLTMIAETMLPEAYEQGGTLVGLATLFGFLSAIFVKLFDK